MTEDKLYARAHQIIEEWLPRLKGETLTREQFHRLLNINPLKKEHIPFKNAVNTVLWNLSVENKNKKIVKVGSAFKIVDDSRVAINFKAGSGSKFDLILPFGIHQYCFLYRKNIMIIYGSKDAGKTALILNIIRLNMNNHRTLLFSSEMVEDELRNRLAKAEGMELDDWNFEAYERSYAFNEVIDPNGFNLIDFLELGGDEAAYYDGVALIRRMYDVLDGGVLVVAIQKNKNAEYPKGGTGMLEKARIALSLDDNMATLTVAKNWADGVTSAPRGKAWSYNLVGGINIVNSKEVG